MQLLEEHGAEFETIEYLKNPPTLEELGEICTTLGIEPSELIRTKEKRYKALGLSADDQRNREEWLTLMVENPSLIERPIVIYNGKAAVGRPPENILALL